MADKTPEELSALADAASNLAARLEGLIDGQSRPVIVTALAMLLAEVIVEAFQHLDTEEFVELYRVYKAAYISTTEALGYDSSELPPIVH